MFILERIASIAVSLMGTSLRSRRTTVKSFREARDISEGAVVVLRTLIASAVAA